MKFFRQTKETKRKISFFVALAMVISLLPVSPVAKAAEKTGKTVQLGNLKVYSNVSGASVSVTTGTGVSTTGEAVITVAASKAISSASLVIEITTGSSFNTNGTDFTEAGSIVTTPSAVTSNAAIEGCGDGEVSNNGKTVTYKYENNNVSGTKIEFKVTGIKEETYVKISGKVVPKDDSPSATPSSSPSATPSSSPSATPSSSPSATPDTSATPVPTHKVSFSDTDFNYDDINLTLPTGVTSGEAISFEEGTKLVFGIEPKGEKTFLSLPVLTVNETEEEWVVDSSNSNKYTATVVVKDETNIAIKGGTVYVLDAKLETPEAAKPGDEAQKEGIDKVTVGAAEGNSAQTFAKDIAQAAILNATTGTAATITVDGKPVTDNEKFNNIIEALADNEKTTVKTVLDVNSNGADGVKEATNALAKQTEVNTVDSNPDAIKALGESATEIKETVQKMVTSDNSVALDITLNSIITSTSEKFNGTAIIKVTDLKGKKIKITINVPTKLKDKAINVANNNGFFYAIRVHGDDVTVIPCTYDKETEEMSFESDKFSTYIISYGDKTTTSTPTPTPSTSPSAVPTPTPGGSGSNGGGGGIGGYVPSVSNTPAPSASASAAPSASPSASASAAPSGSAVPSGSANPSDPGTGNTAEPTKTPGTTATQKPDNDKDDTTGGSTSSVKVGKKVTVSGSKYKVTAVKGTRTVQFTNGKKNAKSVVIPSTVKVSGKNYKVTTIAKNAFKGNKKLKKVTIGANINKIGANAFKGCSKLKSIIIKTKKLTAKKVGNNAFKGINKKATIKVPKAKVKAYKKIVKAKGAGKNVKVKK